MKAVKAWAVVSRRGALQKGAISRRLLTFKTRMEARNFTQLGDGETIVRVEIREVKPKGKGKEGK